MKSAALYSLAILIFIWSTLLAQDEWITILVNGSIGLGSNLTGPTISLIKRDCIEGSSYEKNVLSIREHPYIAAIQPIGPFGLHPVRSTGNRLNGAYVFSELYSYIAQQFCRTQKNHFYTYGWSGLISKKRRYQEARHFYCALKHLIADYQKQKKNPKIRLIGYSHGPTMFLNFAKLRCKEFQTDTFVIDEAFFIGTPINKTLNKKVRNPLFKRIYNIYSRGDKIQRLDIFTGAHFFSDRTFKGKNLDNVTQIELRITAPLRSDPTVTLPSNMRGTVNQSPGHIELWFFGWAHSYYRKNLTMYPLSGALFIPFILHATQKTMCRSFQIDIRPEQEIAIIQTNPCSDLIKMPFMSRTNYKALIDKALTFHPSNSRYYDDFIHIQTTIDINKAYK